MAKGMRIKSVGATINLGNYSSLHIEIGEEAEFAGLDLKKCEQYLRACAKSVNGVLNLPEEKAKETPKEKTEAAETNARDYNSHPLIYDNTSHQYFNDKGVKYTSVTQMLETFYPFGAADVIHKEYLDFAANYGNLVHCAIQNAIVGKPPKKATVSEIVQKTLAAMGEYRNPAVEEIILDHQQELAGRFDALTQNADDDNYTLWDVKTNSSMFSKVESSLPSQLKELFSEHWNTETTFGEHCLQLNIYAYILNKYYLTAGKVTKLKIIHVPDGFEDIYDLPLVDITPLFDAYNRCR